jgi:hypothetical protein
MSFFLLGHWYRSKDLIFGPKNFLAAFGIWLKVVPAGTIFKKNKNYKLVPGIKYGVFRYFCVLF